MEGILFAEMVLKARPIPKSTKELLEKCDAENQFENFDKALRTIIAVPKSEIVKAEARSKLAKARRKRRHG